MSYSDETVRAKLSALNETQESIVTVAQWIMFHRNHAPQTAQIWLQRLKDMGATKRLNLVYLANEVVQQSKARKRDDFLSAFSPIIAEALATAYTSATIEVQHKLRRVVDVWRQREIFVNGIQCDIEARIKDINKTRSSKKGALGGSLHSSGSNSDSLPPEIASLGALHATLSQAQATASGDTKTAETEYTTLASNSAAPPTPPVHAARLSSLLKSLGTAHTAVTASLAARNKLVESLQAMIKDHQEAARKDEATIADLTTKRRAIEAKKAQVEDAIMKGLSNEETAAAAATVPIPNGSSAGAHDEGSEVEPQRPDVEPLTPPPYESFTPPNEPHSLDAPSLQLGDAGSHTPKDEPSLHASQPTVPPALFDQSFEASPDLKSVLATLPPPEPMQQSNGEVSRDPRRVRKADSEAAAAAAKRRKLSQSQSDEFRGFAPDGDAMEGLDEEVVGMLG